MKLNLHLCLSLIVALFVTGVTIATSYGFYNFTYSREQSRNLQAIQQISATPYKTAEITANAEFRCVIQIAGYVEVVSYARSYSKNICVVFALHSINL